MKVFNPVPPKIESVAKQIVKCASRVHKEMGPGLLEEVYRSCLIYELEQHGLSVGKNIQVPLRYDGVRLGEGYHIDLLVDGHVIVDVRSYAELQPIHEMELHTHVRLSGKRVGLLINFNVANMKQAVKRVVL